MTPPLDGHPPQRLSQPPSAAAPHTTRLLLIDPAHDRLDNREIDLLPELLRAGDLLVVNDAATLPASLAAHTRRGEPVEIRLLGPQQAGLFDAVLLGAGDYHTRTEDRPAPPALEPGAQLAVGPQLSAEIVALSALSPRLVQLRFDRTGAQLWAAVYRWGKPIQYAHQSEPLPLWSVQTAYAARPWAAEMPSAGRPLSIGLLARLTARGVGIATLTHAAGISASGEPAIDQALPLPERYELPERTVRALTLTQNRGGRVIAVGTSVVRALEDAWLRGAGQLVPGEAIADLRIDPSHRRAVVDGLLTGVHAPEESHFALLGAFVPAPLLRRSHQLTQALGYREHEFGDACLILPDAPALARA